MDCEQFGIKEEMDPLPTAEIKSEPQDVKSETIPEAEEYDGTYIKHEVHPIAHLDESISQIEDTKQNLEDYVGKSREEYKNGEEDGNEYMPFESYDSFIKDDLSLSRVSEGESYISSVGNKSREEPFINTYCNNLATNINSNDKPFECDFCSKCFSQKNCLLKHMCIHSEKPFKCDFCSMLFSEIIDFETHMGSHTGEKPFTCNICNKSYTRKINLRAHSRTHTGENPFTCNICNRSFSKKSNLNTHMGVHGSEKNFECDVCGKSFFHKYNVVRHVQIHITKKPSCNVCGMSFGGESSLARHICRGLYTKTFNSCLS